MCSQIFADIKEENRNGPCESKFHILEKQKFLKAKGHENSHNIMGTM